jgi:hypothetical protein
MTDVKLEVIDLSTGSSIGTFQLDLCVPQTFKIDIGDYRFIATYLVTGEVQQADVSIVEGENPPLEFTFTPPPTPPPPTHTLTVNSTPIQGVPFTIEKVS